MDVNPGTLCVSTCLTILLKLLSIYHPCGRPVHTEPLILAPS